MELTPLCLNRTTFCKSYADTCGFPFLSVDGQAWTVVPSWSQYNKCIVSTHNGFKKISTVQIASSLGVTLDKDGNIVIPTTSFQTFSLPETLQKLFHCPNNFSMTTIYPIVSIRNYNMNRYKMIPGTMNGNHVLGTVNIQRCSHKYDPYCMMCQNNHFLMSSQIPSLITTNVKKSPDGNQIIWSCKKPDNFIGPGREQGCFIIQRDNDIFPDCLSPIVPGQFLHVKVKFGVHIPPPTGNNVWILIHEPQMDIVDLAFGKSDTCIGYIPSSTSLDPVFEDINHDERSLLDGLDRIIEGSREPEDLGDFGVLGDLGDLGDLETLDIELDFESNDASSSLPPPIQKSEFSLNLPMSISYLPSVPQL